MYKDCSLNPPGAKSGEAVMLAAIFRNVEALHDRNEILLADAFSDATASVRERANIVGDPIRQTLQAAAIDPIVRTVTALTGCDPALVRDVANAVLIESRLSITLETLKAHVADLSKADSPPTIKVTSATPSAVARANAHALGHRLKARRQQA